MNETNDQLKKGAILSYLNLALSSIIPFVYTPIMLRVLGEAEYGLFSLANSVVGYLSLLSFGFGSTILRYLSFYRAKGDKINERKAFGFFLIVYSIVGLLIITAGVIIAPHVDFFFHKGLTLGELSKLRTLVYLMAFSSAITFPISVFSSIVLAHERYVFRKIIDMVGTVLVPVCNLIALFLGYYSVGMAIAGIIAHSIMLPIYMFYCFSILKVFPLFKALPRELIREMFRFSGFAFLGTIVDMLFWSTDKVLLGALANTTAVAVYNIGSTFNNIVMSLSAAIMGLMSPRVTAMVAIEEEQERFSSIFIKVGRIQYLLVALVVSGFAVFGRKFIYIWAGEAYMESYWIAILTMFPLCIPLIQNTGVSIITAKNKHAFRSIIYFVIAVLNVISTALVIPKFGGIGAAFCSGISFILGQGIIMNVFYWKEIGLDIPRFWNNIIRMSGTPFLLFIIGLLIIPSIELSNWLTFFLAVTIYTAIYFAGMYFFAIDDFEKGFFFNIIRRRHNC